MSLLETTSLATTPNLALAHENDMGKRTAEHSRLRRSDPLVLTTLEGGLLHDRHCYFWGLQVSGNLILTSSLWNGGTQNAIIHSWGVEHAVEIASWLMSRKAR